MEYEVDSAEEANEAVAVHRHRCAVRTLCNSWVSGPALAVVRWHHFSARVPCLAQESLHALAAARCAAHQIC
jgi:hypothetical protein